MAVHALQRRYLNAQNDGVGEHLTPWWAPTAISRKPSHTIQGLAHLHARMAMSSRRCGPRDFALTTVESATCGTRDISNTHTRDARTLSSRAPCGRSPSSSSLEIASLKSRRVPTSPSSKDEDCTDLHQTGLRWRKLHLRGAGGPTAVGHPLRRKGHVVLDSEWR